MINSVVPKPLSAKSFSTILSNPPELSGASRPQRSGLDNFLITSLAVFLLGIPMHGWAQDQSQSGRVIEEIVVTATKKGEGEKLQDVALAVTAFNGDMLEDFQVRDVNDLSYSVPNVAIDSSGTVKGLANFSIRGLGVTSSVPSLDPTVGTFVDGVYLGSNYGVILDTFDLEGIEVLRGPQGLLFGRNVTGGAILVNTRDPSHEFSARAKVGVETGPQTTVGASVNGSLVENKLAGKLVGLYKDDQGYYDNAATDNNNFGEDEVYLIRGALAYTPTENTEFVLKVETGELDGDGPPNQNAEFLTGDHDVNIDNEGFSELSWDSIILKSDIDVTFGEGTITNILGWRQVDSITNADIDSRPQDVFTGTFNLEQEQFSVETRYSGLFLDGRWALTTGFYYFTQELLYREDRQIFGGVVAGTFGGNQDTDTWGIFASNDISLTDQLTLTLGLRYTEEEKDAQVATFNPAVSPCTLDPSETCNFDFDDEEDWSNVSPKVALQWFLNDQSNLYASWQRGFRSGGYNLRISNPVQSAGPVDEEEQSAFEIGYKADLLDGRLRTNIALFHSDISDIQRVVTDGDPDNPGAVIQTARNTADATIQGLEVELTAVLSDNLFVHGFLGLIDAEYDSVLFDLTGDGVVTDADLDLRLPLLADVTYGVTLDYRRVLPRGGEIGLLASYSFRDEAESTDANVPGTQQLERDIVNASLRYTSPNENWTASLYGQNLTDEIILQTLAIFPGITTGPGGFGTIQPVAKGRVIGFEVSYNF